MLEESHIYFRKAADVLGLPNKLRSFLARLEAIR